MLHECCNCKRILRVDGCDSTDPRVVYGAAVDALERGEQITSGLCDPCGRELYGELWIRATAHLEVKDGVVYERRETANG